MGRVGSYSAHKTKHQDAGVDEISVAALSGLLADDQHVLDAEALAAAIAGGLSKIIWKDVASAAVGDEGRTVALDWTDVDLTAITSANAKFAILELTILVSVAGTGGSNRLSVRKNGTAPPALPSVTMQHDEPDWARKDDCIILGLDSGQVIEYKIEVATDATVYSYIAVLGYIE